MQAHVTEGQLAERLVQRQRAAAFGLEGRIVEDGEHALGPGKGVLHVHVRAVQTLEGRIQHGKRAHDLAREGESGELAARPIRIERFERTGLVERNQIQLGGRNVAVADFDVVVTASSGTYVRALARDVGEALGTRAHLTSLRRTQIGPWHVDDARTVAQLRDLASIGEQLPAASMAQVCRQVFPVMAIDDAEARALRNGLFIDKRTASTEGTRGEPWPAATFVGDEPAALVSPRSGKLKPDLQLTL